jgi:hypothetical protein
MKTDKAKPFEVGHPAVNFTCDYGVYKRGSCVAICYCRDRRLADFVVDALTNYAGRIKKTKGAK